MNALFRRGIGILLLCSVCFSPLALALTANAGQPYEEGFEPIPQGSAQCGPTAFYMIFNHYGDPQEFEEVDLSEKVEVVTSDTQICRWVNGGSTSGTSWSQLQDAADELHALGSSDPYYVSELNDNFTKYKRSADEQERRDRLDYIVENYLEKNRPVIIHIKRYWFLHGHYLVLTGYDAENETVYYADPNGGSIGEVGYEDFIEEKWYRSPNLQGFRSWLFRGRWDGEWMGFYRENDSRHELSTHEVVFVTSSPP